MDTDLIFESDGTEEEELCSWDPIRCVFTVETTMYVPFGHGLTGFPSPFDVYFPLLPPPPKPRPDRYVAGDVRVRVMVDSSDLTERLLMR
jgi:hypothetical protein